MIGCDPFTSQAVCLNESAKSLILCSWKPSQPFLYNNAVFPLKIHHISHSCHRCRFGKFQDLISVNSICLIKSPDQFPCNHGSTDIFVWIWTARLFRIDHCICFRNNPFPPFIRVSIRDFMMIRYNHCHTLFLCLLNFRRRCNSVVTGNDRIDSVL